MTAATKGLGHQVWEAAASTDHRSCDTQGLNASPDQSYRGRKPQNTIAVNTNQQRRRPLVCDRGREPPFAGPGSSTASVDRWLHPVHQILQGLLKLLRRMILGQLRLQALQHRISSEISRLRGSRVFFLDRADVHPGR